MGVPTISSWDATVEQVGTLLAGGLAGRVQKESSCKSKGGHSILKCSRPVVVGLRLRCDPKRNSPLQKHRRVIGRKRKRKRLTRPLGEHNTPSPGQGAGISPKQQAAAPRQGSPFQAKLLEPQEVGRASAMGATAGGCIADFNQPGMVTRPPRARLLPLARCHPGRASAGHRDRQRSCTARAATAGPCVGQGCTRGTTGGRTSADPTPPEQPLEEGGRQPTPFKPQRRAAPPRLPCTPQAAPLPARHSKST